MNKDNNSIAADEKQTAKKKILPRRPHSFSAEQNAKVITREDLKKKKIYNVEHSSQKRSFHKNKTEQNRVARLRTGNRGRMEIAVGNLSANLNVMINAAHKAGRDLAYDFDELSELKVTRKNNNTLVSEADIVAETTIISSLNKARPDYCFLSEECGKKEGSDNSKKFIIDPLNGTFNFLHGIPLFAISIAMVIDDEVMAAVVYNPITDETFYAEKGNGAYMLTGGTNRRIRVTDNAKFADCIIATGMPDVKTSGQSSYLAKLSSIMNEAGGIRSTGSSVLDLAYVAAGRYDGYFESGKTKPWNTAAGILLVREAGGYVCNYDGNEKDGELFTGNGIIASNDSIKVNFKKLLNK